MLRLSRLMALTTICPALVTSMLLLTASVSAGGFQLGVETPQAGAGSQPQDAVLTVRTYGCHTPSDAVIKATAEGLLNGERKSLKLNLSQISTGVYAIKQEWPAEGVWVLSINGEYGGMQCGVLVQLGENGKVKPGTRLEAGYPTGTNARAVRRKLSSSDIDDALHGRPAVAKEESGSQGSTWPIAGVGAVLSLAGLFVLGRRRFLMRQN